MCATVNCGEHLATDDLQFGVKCSVACCSQAIFTLRSVIDYFISRVSRPSAYCAASLDISKAFDTVCHTKLLQCLIDAGMPGWIVLVIENWYSKLCVVVRLR